MLISLHLPKTAGTSFRLTLEGVYGSRLLSDYDDMSAIQDYLSGEIDAKELEKKEKIPISIDVDCVHGHFLPMKYKSLEMGDKKKVFVTWLRDPFSRMVSHYHFFKRTYNPQYAGKLFRKVIEENWTLNQFCLSNEFRNIYTKYLVDFPLEDFSFVGITEYYNEDMIEFSKRFIGLAPELHHVNASESNEAGKALADNNLRQEVEAFHATDYDLYYRALDARNRRICNS
jgi:hypothetical protein